MLQEAGLDIHRPSQDAIEVATLIQLAHEALLISLVGSLGFLLGPLLFLAGNGGGVGDQGRLALAFAPGDLGREFRRWSRAFFLGAEAEVNFAVLLALLGLDHPFAGGFEGRYQQRHAAQQARLVLEQGAEGGGAGDAGGLDQFFDRDFEGNVVLQNRAGALATQALKQVIPKREQQAAVEFAQVDTGSFLGVFRQFLAESAGMAKGAIFLQLGKKPDRLLEAAIGQKLADQALARVEQLVGPVILRILALFDQRRGHRPRLDLQQGGGHEDEIAGQFQVEFPAILPGPNQGDKLIGDTRQGDVADVQLVFTDEKQQEVKGAAETVDADRQTEVRGLGGIGSKDGVRLGHGPGC